MKKEILKVQGKKALPFLVVQTFFPVGILLAIQYLPISGGEMLVFLLLFPLLTTCNAFIYGTKQFFFWGYPLLAGICFLPTVFFLQNLTAMVYVLWYGGFALFGMTLGFWSKKVFKLLKKASIKGKLG